MSQKQKRAIIAGAVAVGAGVTLAYLYKTGKLNTARNAALRLLNQNPQIMQTKASVAKDIASKSEWVRQNTGNGPYTEFNKAKN